MKDYMEAPGINHKSRKSTLVGASHLLLYCFFCFAALFIPHGKWSWIEGWIFVLLFTLFLLSAFIPLSKNSYLLEARIRSPFKRQQKTLDKLIFALLSFLHLLWIFGIGLENSLFGRPHKFGIAWTTAGGAVFVLAIVCINAVVSGNPYLIPAVGYQENQKIINSGIYSWVRHPMYATTIAMSFGGSLLTSSFAGLVISIFISAIFWLRLILEEKFLVSQFPEYSKYMAKVKYRLFPFIV